MKRSVQEYHDEAIKLMHAWNALAKEAEAHNVCIELVPDPIRTIRVESPVPMPTFYQNVRLTVA